MIAKLVSTILGAGLIYLVVSFVAIGINEWLSGARGSRGKFLKQGIKRLLPDAPIFRRAMRHPLISGMYRDQAMLGNPPSYISPANFAAALLDVVWTRARVAGCNPTAGTRLDRLRLSLETLEHDHPVVAASILAAIDRSADYEQASAAIEGWYSRCMERVTGWYARFVRKRIFVIALLIAAAVNIGGIHVARAFWESAPGVSSRVEAWPVGYSCVGGSAPAGAAASGCARAFVSEVTTLAGLADLLGSILDWLVTAVAVALGAPYLFQLFRMRRAS